MTRVRDLMSPGVHVAAETDSLTAVARLVRPHDVGSLATASVVTVEADADTSLPTAS